MKATRRIIAIFLLMTVFLSTSLDGFSFSPSHSRSYYFQTQQRGTIRLWAAANRNNREQEIRRKIQRLKRQGKINKTNTDASSSSASNSVPESASSSSSSSSSSYESKIRRRLGANKSKLLGFGVDEEEEEEEEDDYYNDLDDDEENDTVDENDNGDTASQSTRARIGAIPNTEQDFDKEDQDQGAMTKTKTTVSSSTTPKIITIDPSLFDVDEKDKENSPEMTEEELVDLVAAKLAEQQQQQQQQRESTIAATVSTTSSSTTSASTTTSTPLKTTSGVGGTWQKPDSSNNNGDDSEDKEELYKPKSGSWGAFPRPRNISTAYGGGRRVGAGYSNEAEDVDATLNTQNLLREYRKKVGIDVPSEKEHAAQIEEALTIAQLAMQRGIYATAVSSLEKVTQWCSTNSPVGSKIFLELAMAYEASGRTQEAYQVYKTLTDCRMEEVKFQAKRLLYGLEAMEFMKGVSEDFSRKKAKNTFIDTTGGLANIASNFDDVYQTAYVDLDNGYYKKLTKSVVRSNREARQILLKAKGKDEVPRMKIIQALRSIARNFDDALDQEVEAQKMKEPTAFINGKPLIIEQQRRQLNNENDDDTTGTQLDGFVLASPEQMLTNLDGPWKLQLLADKTGDGVSFFNTTDAEMSISTSSDTMSFTSSGPSGLAKVECEGSLEWDASKRIVSRVDVETTAASGSIFGLLGSNQRRGFLAAVTRSEQIITVDSTLLITKSPYGMKNGKDAEKEHFAVWRRI